jgi:hypothetical protein
VGQKSCGVKNPSGKKIVWGKKSLRQKNPSGKKIVWGKKSLRQKNPSGKKIVWGKKSLRQKNPSGKKIVWGKKSLIGDFVVTHQRDPIHTVGFIPLSVANSPAEIQKPLGLPIVLSPNEFPKRCGGLLPLQGSFEPCGWTTPNWTVQIRNLQLDRSNW